MIQELTTGMDIFLKLANIIVVIYAVYRFLGKPTDTLESKYEELKKRVDEHDLKFKEVDESLHHGNDRFRKQEDLNEVFINCMLAFVDFERAYCSHNHYEDTEDLDNAKDTLRKYLARK